MHTSRRSLSAASAASANSQQPDAASLSSSSPSSPFSPSFLTHPSASSPRRFVLGVETSCDDTAMAILDADGNVVSHASASQWHLYEQYHGIQPIAAADEHKYMIDTVFAEVLRAAGLPSASSLSGVAVTAGPGLAPCLKIGLDWSSRLARSHSLPYIGVHHMQAHAMVAKLDHPSLRFPFLALLVSGGHTEMWLVESWNRMTILVQTCDDAIGEAFDKGARMIQIERRKNEAPGAALERMASNPNANPHAYPLQQPKRMDQFSFAGIKSKLQRLVMQLGRDMEEVEASGRKLTPELEALIPDTDPLTRSMSLPNAYVQKMARLMRLEITKHAEDVAATASHTHQPIITSTAISTSSSPSTDVASTSELAPTTPSPLRPLPLSVQSDLCASFQWSLVDQVCQRVLNAFYLVRHRYPHLNLQHLVVAGGVACNQFLRNQLTQIMTKRGVQVISPRPLHCMDNGIMIGYTGLQLLKMGHSDQYDLAFHTRWPVGPHMEHPLSPEQKRKQERRRKKAEGTFENGKMRKRERRQKSQQELTQGLNENENTDPEN